MGEGGITHNSNLPSALYQRCPARELPSAGSSSRIFGPLSSALCPAVYPSIRPSRGRLPAAARSIPINRHRRLAILFPFSPPPSLPRSLPSPAATAQHKDCSVLAARAL